LLWLDPFVLLVTGLLEKVPLFLCLQGTCGQERTWNASDGTTLSESQLLTRADKKYENILSNVNKGWAIK
jgi:hypothetical protein